MVSQTSTSHGVHRPADGIEGLHVKDGLHAYELLSFADADNGVVQNVSIFRNSTIELTLTMPERRQLLNRIHVKLSNCLHMQLSKWIHVQMLNCNPDNPCSESKEEY